jgi:hypothetical protein
LKDSSQSSFDKTDEEILQLQKKKWPLLGNRAPCSLSSVTDLNMKLGKRFNNEPGVTLSEFSSVIAASENIGDSRLSQLVKKSTFDSKFIMNIQCMGGGKSKEMYDLALENHAYILYCSIGTAGGYDVYRGFRDNVLKQIEIHNRNSEELFTAVSRLAANMMYAMMIHLRLLLDAANELGLNITPSDHFQLTVSGEMTTVGIIYVYIVKCDHESVTNSIREINKTFTFPVIVGYDEAQEFLKKYSEIPSVFLSRKVGEQHKRQINMSVWHPFVGGIAEISKFGRQQVLLGTSLEISNLMDIPSLSVFKPGEVTILSPLGIVSATELHRIIQYYFPGLKLSHEQAERWASRPIIVFEYFLTEVFRAAIRVTDIKQLQESFNQLEASWYQGAVNLLILYLRRAKQAFGPINVKNQSVGSVSVTEFILHVFHDTLFSRGHTKLSLPPEGISIMVEVGLLMLREITRTSMTAVVAERAGLDALYQTIMVSNEQDDQFLHLLRKECYDQVERGIAGPGLEKYSWYYYIRSLKLATKLSDTTLFKEICVLDPSIDHYQFEGEYDIAELSIEAKKSLKDPKADLNSADERIVKILREKRTDIMVKPLDQTSGEDRCFLLRRKSDAPNDLPEVRVVKIQDVKQFPRAIQSVVQS